MAEGFSRRVFLATIGGLAVLWALPARGWSFFLTQFETSRLVDPGQPHLSGRGTGTTRPFKEEKINP